MKRINLFMIALVAVFAIACGGAKDTAQNEQEGDGAEGQDQGMEAAALSDGTYMVSEEDQLGWKGTKVTGEHYGTVEISEGKFTVENGNITAGDFTFDMASIHCEDLADNEELYNKLIGHLKSADFFSADSFPQATFTIKKVMAQAEGDSTHSVTGDLTIKGITNEVTFPAKVMEEGGTVKFMSAFNIDRTKWSIKYGSGQFFEDLGDKMIYDDILITLNLTGMPAEGDAMTEEEGAMEEEGDTEA